MHYANNIVKTEVLKPRLRVVDFLALGDPAAKAPTIGVSAPPDGWASRSRRRNHVDAIGRCGRVLAGRTKADRAAHL